MKHYSVHPGELPELDRVDYRGYGYDEVIDPHKARTFKEAKSQYKLQLETMIKLCKDRLGKIKDMKPEDCYQTIVR